MKVFLISNGIWEFDGRLRELIKVASELGEIKYITRSKNTNFRTDDKHIKVRENNYFQFIVNAVVQGLKLKDIDILFVDNRKAIIPALILKLFRIHAKVILDVRELYLSKEVKRLIGKIGCFFEGIMIEKADVVICANKYRAELMKEYYRLNKTPLIYENLRRLQYSSDFDCDELKRKYNEIITKNSFKIISTSGCSVSRTNDTLVEAVAMLGKGYDLLLVGGRTKKDEMVIQNIIDKNNLNNVHLIQSVEEDELKYLISISQLGIVNYHQKDLNNKYCASGKIYEFIFENLPVVTTENPPLKEICQDFNIGVSDDDYVNGIVNINGNYLYYKNNVKSLSNRIDVEKNNQNLVLEIRTRMGL